MTWAVVAALLGGGALGTIITALFKFVTDKRAAKTDNWAQLAAAYSRQISDMAESYGALDARLQRVENDLAASEERGDKFERELSDERLRSTAAISAYRDLRSCWLARYPNDVLPDVPAILRNVVS